MSRTDPLTHMRAATPHATNPLPSGAPRAVYCTTGGNLVCSFDDDLPDVTIPMDAKQLLPIQPLYIRATSTAVVLLGY